METAVTPQHLVLAFDAGRSLMTSTWDTPAVLDEDFYKSLMVQHVEFYQAHKPDFMLVDARLAFYGIPPHVQEWINGYTFPKYVELGLKSMAVVVSSDLITNLSMEQTLEAVENSAPWKFRYFDSVEAAQAWLV